MRALLLAITAFAAAACQGGATLDYKSTTDLRPEVLDPTENPVNPPVAAACDFGFSYQGFGGTRLEAGRADEEIGFDRDRVKPFSALAQEYERVLGAPAPALLSQLSNTFGEVPPRWHVEPQATAVSLYSALRVAFVGCLGFTDDSEYDALPDATNAVAKCSALARRFWSRSPDADEVQACVHVATAGTGGEPQPRRKWAYACSSVLSSAPFLTF